MTVPFTLPTEILDEGRRQREQSAFEKLTADLDRQVKEGLEGINRYTQQSPLARVLSEGGLKTPTLEDLTPTWVSEAIAEEKRRSQPPQTPSGTPSAMPAAPVQPNVTIEDGRQQPQPRMQPGETIGDVRIGQGPAPAPASGEIDNSSREAFVRTAYPYMLEAAEGDANLAELMLAKAISENGSIGTGRPFWANNFSGLKGEGDAGSVEADTWEDYGNGPVNIRDRFAAYSTPQKGMAAFMQFLRDNSRYHPALARYQQTGDADQLFRDILAAGYATDKAWADKVQAIRASQVAPIVRGQQPVAEMQRAPLNAGAASPSAPAAPSQEPAPATPPAGVGSDPLDAQRASEWQRGSLLSQQRPDEMNPEIGIGESTRPGRQIRDGDMGYPTDWRGPGSMPYDVTDDEGLNRSEPPDRPFSPPGPAWTMPGLSVPPDAMYRQTLEEGGSSNPYAEDPSEYGQWSAPPRPPTPTYAIGQGGPPGGPVAGPFPLPSRPGDDPGGSVFAAEDSQAAVPRYDPRLVDEGPGARELATQPSVSPVNQVNRYAPSYAPQASQVTAAQAPQNTNASRAVTGLAEAASNPMNAVNTVVEGVGNAGRAAWEAANPSDPAQRAVDIGKPPMQRGMEIVQAATDEFGATVGRRVAQAMGIPDTEIANVIGQPVTTQDAAGFVGSAVLDPTNLIGAGPARQVARRGAEVAQEGARAVGRGVRALGEEAAGQMLEAGMGPRMIQPSGMPGRPTQRTVEWLEDRIDYTKRVIEDLDPATEGELLQQAKDRLIRLESEWVDAVNARRALEPAIASDVGRRADEPLPARATPEEVVADRGQMVSPRERVSPDDAADLGGPASVPVSTYGRENAAMPFDPASAAAGGAGVGAATSDDGETDPEWMLAGLVAGGVLNKRFVARWRQSQARAAAQAAAARAAGKAPPPSTNDWMRSIGYSGMIGPSTGIVNAVGNGVELLWHLPKDLTRALVRGKPREAWIETRGLAAGLMHAGGEMLDALAGAHPGGGVETARLSQRVTNPIASFVAQALEAPTRVFSEVPDAFYRSIATKMGEYRRAAQIASDEGLNGPAWSQRVDALLAEVANHKNGQLTLFPGQVDQIVNDGVQLAERLTLRGEVGSRGQAFSNLIQALGPVGHLFWPFFNTPYQMSQRMLERVPGVGARMGTQPARFDKAYDQIAGGLVLAGMGGLGMAGLITGSGPDDPEQRKSLQARGWQANSTLVSGTWVPNNAFGVWAPMLDAAGEAGDATRYGKKDAQVGDKVKDAIKRAGGVISNQVYLRGVSDIIKAVGSPGERMEAYAANTLGRAIPLGASARMVATAEDPYERRAEPAKEVGSIENVRQRIGRSIPNELPNPLVPTRGQLPIDQDILGRPVENPRSGVASLGPRMNQPKADAVLELFERAGVEIGNPRSEVADSGVQIDLSAAETRRWNELRGQEIVRVTQRLIDGGTLGRAPLARQQERLEGVRSDAAERATAMLRREIGAAEWNRRRREAQTKARAS